MRQESRNPEVGADENELDLGVAVGVKRKRDPCASTDERAKRARGASGAALTALQTNLATASASPAVAASTIVPSYDWNKPICRRPVAPLLPRRKEEAQGFKVVIIEGKDTVIPISERVTLDNLGLDLTAPSPEEGFVPRGISMGLFRSVRVSAATGYETSPPLLKQVKLG